MMKTFLRSVISIFESCSEIGQKGKDQVVSRYVKELNIGETEANNIFDCVLNLIKKGIKDKLKNPFKKQLKMGFLYKKMKENKI